MTTRDQNSASFLIGVCVEQITDYYHLFGPVPHPVIVIISCVGAFLLLKGLKWALAD